MSDSWYYTSDKNSRVGPLPLSSMQVLAGAGVIQPNFWVLPPGARQWVQAADVAELFAPAPAARPVAPDPVDALPVVTAVAESHLTGTWAGQVMNDAGAVENECFVFSHAGNPVHAYQAMNGRPVFVEVTHVGQVIEYAGPAGAGRLTVQALIVKPDGAAWQAHDYSVKSGGLSTPGSYVSGRTTNSVIIQESQLRGSELDVQTVCRWGTDSNETLRDFGSSVTNFNMSQGNTIWKRGTLRRISDDPDYLARKYGG